MSRLRQNKQLTQPTGTLWEQVDSFSLEHVFLRGAEYVSAFHSRPSEGM